MALGDVVELLVDHRAGQLAGARPAGCSSSGASGPTASSCRRRRRARRRAAAARPVPAAAQGQAHVPPRRDFSTTEVDAGVVPVGSVDIFALGTGIIRSRAVHRHQRRSAPSRSRRGECPELRLLENGREDERQCGQRVGRPSGRRVTLSVNSVAGSHRSQHERRQLRLASSQAGLITRPTGARHPPRADSARVPALSHQSFRPVRFGGRSSRFLTESLILAQDERWRRA